MMKSGISSWNGRSAKSNWATIGACVSLNLVGLVAKEQAFEVSRWDCADIAVGVWDAVDFREVIGIDGNDVVGSASGSTLKSGYPDHGCRRSHLRW